MRFLVSEQLTTTREGEDSVKMELGVPDRKRECDACHVKAVTRCLPFVSRDTELCPSAVSTFRYPPPPHALQLAEAQCCATSGSILDMLHPSASACKTYHHASELPDSSDGWSGAAQLTNRRSIGLCQLSPRANAWIADAAFLLVPEEQQ